MTSQFLPLASRRLRFSQLIVFSQVLRSGSILHAAEQMNLTQPAVSKIVHELENHFGGALLIRSNRGVIPTELGKIVDKRAKSVLAELRDMDAEVHAFNKGIAGQVLIGTLISASSDLLPKAIQLLKEQAPEVLVTLRVGQMDQLLPALSVGDLDLVVARIPNDGRWQITTPQIEVEALYSEPLCMVASPAHPLAKLSHLTLQSTLAYPWILPTRDASLRQTVNQFFRKQGQELPSNLVESLSVLTNIGLMLDNKTVGLMPLSTAKQLTQAQILTILPLQDLPMFGDIGYFQGNNREHSAAVELFKECLHIAAAAHLANDPSASLRAD